jgi:hypothetical protein
VSTIEPQDIGICIEHPVDIRVGVDMTEQLATQDVPRLRVLGRLFGIGRPQVTDRRLAVDKRLHPAPDPVEKLFSSQGILFFLGYGEVLVLSMTMSRVLFIFAMRAFLSHSDIPIVPFARTIKPS